ncbi:nucleoside diphosphate kinase 6 [Eupeodes corollae]|uniref:nucleoside diphosphate kinase 6 n=1 Tax=Eupeodes corollae TaxID=290404 RepID=UPI002492DAFB|nr:nucleoside diphosphate kinase 6 [Eupeodes corollae]
MEITFALIKPHAVKNIVALKYVTDIIKHNFSVLQTKEVVITKQLASRFYEEHQGKFFYNRLVTFMGSGPSIAFVLASKGSIAKWRTMLGPTKVHRAVFSSPDSIRSLYGLSDTRNACHGSDSLESASREISIIFPDFDYDKELLKQMEAI